MAYFLKALMKYREENNMVTIMYVNKHMKSWYLLISKRFDINIVNYSVTYLLPTNAVLRFYRSII